MNHGVGWVHQYEIAAARFPATFLEAKRESFIVHYDVYAWGRWKTSSDIFRRVMKAIEFK
jgi:hypothetical protein